jgi:hypothetical protein
LRRFLSAVAIAGAVLTPALGRAATSPLNYTILGAGNLSCGSWKAHRSSHDAYEATMESWVLGFVTSQNVWETILHHPEMSVNTDADGIFGWIDNYCAAHPLDNLASAAVQLATRRMETPGNWNPARSSWYGLSHIFHPA